MKGYLVVLFFLSLLNFVVADCNYWSGTAPFCSGSCPSNCRREATSKCGNGACCWTGKKALCNCCPTNDLCTPTQTEAYCLGKGWLQPVAPLMCRNVMLSNWPPPQSKRTCSTYVCGLCILGGSTARRDLQERYNDKAASCDAPNASNIHDMFKDLITLDKNMTETDIDRVLEAKYGKRLTDDEMKHVKVVRVHPPNVGDGDDSECTKKAH